jgi:hypothetical protein
VEQRRYLYHARINAHLTLEQIAIRTSLSPTVLRNLDEGRFERLPSGVYARSYVRTFAAAVGIDPEAALSELEPLLPGAPDPVPALNALRADEWPIECLLQWRASWEAGLATLREAAVRQIARIRRLLDTAVEPVRRINENDVVARTALEYTEAGICACVRAFDDLRRRTRPWKEAALARVPASLRRMAAATDDARRQAPVEVLLLGSPAISRFGAAAIDAALLLVVDAFLVLLISWSSGIPVDALLRDAGWALGTFCAIPIALYFLLFGGIAGSTLGRYICDLIEPLHAHHVRPDHPLTLPDILRRAVRR